MTRIVAGLRSLSREIPPATKEEHWFTHQVLSLAGNMDSYHLSPALMDGGRITAVQIQTLLPAQTVSGALRVMVVLTNLAVLNIGNILQEEQVIDWQLAGFPHMWYSIGVGSDELWELNKIVHGAHRQIGIFMHAMAPGDYDCRVGVRYTP